VGCAWIFFFFAKYNFSPTLNFFGGAGGIHPVQICKQNGLETSKCFNQRKQRVMPKISKNIPNKNKINKELCQKVSFCFFQKQPPSLVRYPEAFFKICP
jgi:hypothetical protein